MTRQTRLIISFALLTAATLVTATAGALADGDLPMAKAETVGMSTRRLERIHDYIQGYMDRNEIAGAVTMVARHGKVVHFEAQGLRDKDDHTPMQKDTIFSLMSMTKPIVSTALMMLWEEGRFLLDDPIAKWLPSYADKQVMEQGKLVKAKPVTVRQILTHTSGLSLTGTDGPAVENALASQEQRDAALLEQQRQRQAQSQPQQTRPKTVAEAIERAAPLPLNFQPGSQWQYGSSTDFVAVLVEKMTNMTIDQFLRERMFQPLGMRDTYYNIPREKVGRVATVYRPDKDGHITLLRKPEYREPTTYFPGVAGLNATAADYFRFAQMLLNGGDYDGQRLLGRMTVNQMFSNQIGSGKTVYVRGEGWGFGLGAGVLTDPAKSADGLSIGTWSWGGADGTLFYIDPREDLVALLMVQLNPYARSQIRPKFSNVVSQAIIDSTADQKPRVMGYDTPR
jgi:CubicO group peptidase (beta-lactamase class C family)